MHDNDLEAGITIAPVTLEEFVRRIFQAVGAKEAGARQVAESLVASELAGHASHGVVRVCRYLENIAAGELQPTAEPVIVHQTPTIALVDGKWGFGQLAARLAMEIAIDKAREQGLAAAGVVNCTHIGRLGEWVEMAAQQELIGLGFCNGGREGGSVAPYGAARRLLGTNPIAAAVPASGRPPVVIDFASSVVAEGKLKIARNRGGTVPEGWVIGADGQPSASAEDYYAGGAILPAAGHKGYGLSLLVEFLGGILTGRGSTALPPFAFGNGVLFVVFCIDAFRPLQDFLTDAAALCNAVKNLAPAPGFDEVLLPGEPEHRAAERYRGEGLLVDEATWAQLTSAAAELGVAIPS
jgi:LDH2 family malate/lactate/ureidoglycolate dehydrogenase